MTARASKPRLQAPWRVGIDVGGTFTDMVLVDRAGDIHVAKSPSTPSNPSIGVIAVLEQAAAELGTTSRDLLKNCDHFVHASTVATNIVLERRAPPVGMLVTKGFRDSLAIRRGIRHNAWAHREPFPPPLSPRHLRLAVRGRINRHGHEIERLAEDDIRAAIALFRQEHVQSIAVCFYNSFLNIDHEWRAGEILNQEYPEASITLSSRVTPVIGEFERSSTAVLNAYIAPKVVAYLAQLARDLKERGLDAPVLVVQNNGGSLTIDKIEERPVSQLLSGPAAAAGALALYNKGIGSSDLLSMEIGGTSCDVMLVSSAGITLASEFEFGGYHVSMPSIDIHSIGAGGGTIAGVDRSGMLFVGPRGAGADPGPAAYGFGGEEPTVTDAQLVLGRLKPGNLAGKLALDFGLAKRSIDAKIGGPLRLTTEAAAAGIVRLVEQELLHATQKLTAERGRDPRGFVLVATGGSGPMHGASIGRKLNSPAVYIPRLAGAFCALGMLNAPIKHEFARAFIGVLGRAIARELHVIVAELEGAARDQLRTDGFEACETRIVRALDLRHPGQIGTLLIEISSDDSEINLERVASDFLTAHENQYGHANRSAPIEVTNVRVMGIGDLPTINLATSASVGGIPEAHGQRQVYFERASGCITTNIYRGAELWPGAQISGPAIIEETTMTVVIGPDDICSVDTFGNYLIQFQNGQRQ